MPLSSMDIILIGVGIMGACYIIFLVVYLIIAFKAKPSKEEIAAKEAEEETRLDAEGDIWGRNIKSLILSDK